MKLAERGWDVTGIEIASTALDRARNRASEAGLNIRFLDGDVTALQAAGAGFRLVLDIGTVHGLSPAQRATAGRAVNAVTAPEVTLLKYAIAPARRGPRPRGR